MSELKLSESVKNIDDAGRIEDLGEAEEFRGSRSHHGHMRQHYASEKEVEDWETMVQGLPEELRLLFRQMMNEPFPPDYGESDDFGFNVYQQHPKPIPEEPKKRNFGFGYGGGDQEKSGVATEALVSFGLSHAGKAVDSCQIAYLKLELRNKNLSNIDAVSGYIHLRNVDLSDNVLTDLHALKTVPHLQVLNVQGNRIESVAQVPHFAWLQALNLSKNQLTNLDGFQPNNLRFLNLSHNRLKSVDDYLGSNSFSNLLSLELRGNKLQTLQGLDLPSLCHLYIADNALMNLEGLSGCPFLEFLHARDNRIQVLTDFSPMKRLKRLNLRGNSIWRFTETIRLEDCLRLEILNLEDNPISKSEKYVLEMSAACLKLKRLDKRLLSELELIDGRLLRTGRSKGVGNPLEDDLELARLVKNRGEFGGEGGGE